MSDTKRKWKHRPGDTYRVLIGSVVGNPDAGFTVAHDLSLREHANLDAAIREGLTEYGRSDDFNVAVTRGGVLMAVLWMDEVVDDEDEVLREIAQEVGLR